MKKLLSIILTACLLLSMLSTLAACSSETDNTPSTDENSDEKITDKHDEATGGDTYETENDQTESKQPEETQPTESEESSKVTEAPEETNTETETEPAPVIYTVTFAVNGEKYAEVTYTEGAESIEIPAVPTIEGMIVCWEDFTLGNENITVNAIIYSDGLVYTAATDSESNKEYYLVSGYEGSMTDIIIPASHEGVEVRGIADEAFRESALTSVVILEGVKNIGESAFYKSAALISIYVPASIEIIGDHAFSQCDVLTSVTLAEGLTLIGKSMFSGCDALASITIPSTVTTIKSSAFSSCVALTEITVPAGVQVLPEGAFQSCSLLATVNLNEGLVLISSKAFSDCAALEAITLPDSLQRIAHYAFERCIKLKTVNSRGVDYVSEYAFNSCISLESTIHVHSYGEETVVLEPTCGATGINTKTCSSEDCEHFVREVITAATGNHTYGNAEETAALSCTTDGEFTKTCTVCEHKEVTVTAHAGHYFGDWTVNAAATCVADGSKTRTCKNCGTDETVTLTATGNHKYTDGTCTVCSTPASYTEELTFTPIADNTAYSVSLAGDELELTEIVIPAYVDGIPVTKIGYLSSPTATTLYIPETITDISETSCYKLQKLTTIYFNATDCPNVTKSGGSRSSNGAFVNAGSEGEGITLYIGANVKTVTANLFSAQNGSYVKDSYLKSVVFEEGSVCTTIGENAFYRCTNLSYINIPDTVEYIGSFAFSGNRGLTEFTIPKNLKSAGGYAFNGLYALTTLYYNAVNFKSLPNEDGNFSSYGDFALFSGTGVEEGVTVYIGADVEYIPATIFSAYNSNYLPNIKNVIFDKDSKCAVIGSFAFESLDLQTIVIPKALTQVYKGAFSLYDPYGYEVNSKVYYYGTADEWSSITVNDENNMLGGTGSTVYFYSETAPETEGNFWHMVYGIPMAW